MRGNVQKIVAGVVVVIVLAFIFLRGDQLVELADTVQRGMPIFLILAVVAQLGKYVAQGFAYRFCFDTVGGDIPFRTGLQLVFGTFFVNTIAPSLNLAGATLVTDVAIKRGIPAGKGTSAALLMQLTIDSGFVLIMLVTFTVLSFTVGLEPGWFALGLIAVVLVGGLVAVMIVGGLKPDLVIRVMKPVVRLINKILARFKRDPIDDFAVDMVHSFSGAAKLIVKHPKKTVRAFACSLCASACEISCFSLSGLAFGVSAPEALICGYVVATLFAMISFIPQGVGVVEAAVTVAFGLFGLGGAAGLATVIVYRSIVFWMPFLIGAVVIQHMTKKGGRKKDGHHGREESSAADEGSC